MQKKDFPYLFFLLILTLGFFLLPSVMYAGVIPQPPNNLGLVGYWSFEGTADSTVDDYSGNGNTGTMTNMDTGTDYVTGYKSSSTGLDFDSTNDYVALGSGSSIDDIWDGGGTLSFWTYTRSDGSGVNGRYIQKDNGTNGWQLFMYDDGGENRLVWGARFSTQSYFNRQLGTFPYNEWTHIVITYDSSSSANRLTYYVNGVDVGEVVDVAPSGSYQSDASLDLEIGRESDNSDFLDGVMDDIRLYSRSLSASDIETLYTQSKYAKTQSHDKTNLVGYWSFEDATGTSATDFSGNGNTGTLTNMSSDDWVGGRVGKALDFDGSGDYVDLGNDSSLVPADQVSVSLWVKPGTGNELYDVLFMRDNSVSRRYALDIGTGGNTFNWSVFADSFVSVNSTTDFIPGQWYHLVGTYDGSNARIYVNGAEEDSASLTGNVISQDGTSLGGYIGSRLYDFNGQLDEVRVYNTALTATQIQNLYQNSKYTQINTPQNNKLTNGLVGYWTFNGADVSGTTIKDVSGNGNTGTATNGPVPTIGKVGQGYSFDGVDDYVTLAQSTLSGLTNMTIASWVYLDSIAADRTIVSALKTGTAHYWSHYVNTSGNIEIAYQAGGDCDHIFTTGLSVGRWYHVTLVKNAGLITAYIDGDSAGSTSESCSGAISNNNGSTRIGSADGGRFMDGRLDEVRIYNKVLTTDEIERLYNLGR